MLVVHLFVSYAHVNLCHIFSSSWCQELAATSACGSSWTFLFTVLLSTERDINMLDFYSEIKCKINYIVFIWCRNV